MSDTKPVAYGYGYLLLVPVWPSAAPGGAPRFTCCLSATELGHAEGCTEVRRRAVIEDALRRAGLVAQPLAVAVAVDDVRGADSPPVQERRTL